MDWVASFWNSIAQFFGYASWEWGNAGDWFAAIGTAAAAMIAATVFRHEVNRRRRSQADEFAMSVLGTLNVDVGDGATRGQPELMIRATNTSRAPIWMPRAYIPRDDGVTGWIEVNLFEPGEPILEPDESVRRAVPIADPEAVSGLVLVRFRDARNNWWMRYVESGRYLRRSNRWIAERLHRKMRIFFPGSRLFLDQDDPTSTESPPASSR